MHETKRIALGVRYDGHEYHGWQQQLGNLKTVQSEIQRAIGCVATHDISVICAGRTDAGVHACEQVVHFDTSVERTNRSWVFGTNAHLPKDITALWAKEVDANFHARFSARRRRYRYLLYNYNVRPGIMRHAVGWYHKELDVSLMQSAAVHLLGEHDFSAFRGAGCQAKSPVRTLYELTIMRHKHLIIIEVEANAFLLHMVRNLVGSLIAVGSLQYPPSWLLSVLKSKDRKQAGVTVSPAGLYLVDVTYDSSYDLPKIPQGPFFLHGTMI